MPKKNKLPNKPSEILKVALADLEAVEAMPDKFQINMSRWVRKPAVGPCEVCHAGAVMVRTLNCQLKSVSVINPETLVSGPDEFDHRTRAKLEFINFIRTGSIEDALNELVFVNLVSRAKVAKVLKNLKQVFNSGFGGISVGVPELVSIYEGYEDGYKNYISGVIGIFEEEGI